jgi:hypothetical protein
MQQRFWRMPWANGCPRFSCVASALETSGSLRFSTKQRGLLLNA